MPAGEAEGHADAGKDAVASIRWLRSFLRMSVHMMS